MKKFFYLTLLFLTISILSDAQSRFGIKAGLNFNTLENVTKSGSVQDAWKSQTGYYFGILGQFKVPLLGIAVQPELLYSKLKTVGPADPAVEGVLPPYSYLFAPNEIELDYLILPINIQLGLDLLILRPYVFVSPYISYALQKRGDLAFRSWDDINRFDYGVGAGIGIDIWKLQIAGKYNWGLGNIKSATNTTWEDKYNNAKIQGFQLSVAFLF